MLNIYLTNLGKYNEGELLGEWLELPATEEEFEKVFKHIGINEQYEEYFISDYETDIDGLEIGEYDNIKELNEITETINNLDAYELEALQAYLVDNNVNEAIEQVQNGNYMIYSDCDNMEDVAYQIVEESGLLNNVHENIARYFDYEAYGRDLDLNGNFYNVGNDIVEIY